MDIDCDEMLNAYVDGELDISDRNKIQDELEGNLDLQQRIDQLREVSNMVKKAYQGIIK